MSCVMAIHMEGGRDQKLRAPLFNLVLRPAHTQPGAKEPKRLSPRGSITKMDRISVASS